MHHTTVFGTLGTADLNIWLCNSAEDNSGYNILSDSTHVESDTLNEYNTTLDSSFINKNTNQLVTDYSRIAVYYDSTTKRKYVCDEFSITFIASEELYQIIVQANEGGTVEKTVSNSDYPNLYKYEETVTLTATPDEGYRFVKWSDGNTNAVREITVTGKATYTAEFELITYNLTVNAGTGGTVSGGGTYTTGSSVTISATPKAGYKFVKWSDGNTSASRTITVTANATYTATFIPIFVTYDSIFSFSKWKEVGILDPGGRITISNITDTGFTATGIVDDAYTNECFVIPATKGTEYTIECDTSNSYFEIFVFNLSTANTGVNSWSSSSPQFTMRQGTNKFNFTAVTDYISIRCDVVGAEKVVDFSNFRIYPSAYSYMSNSVSAANRSDIAAWSIPTPTRSNYTFLGWYTQPNGGGTKYTSSNTYPSDDLTLYSSWKINTHTITTSATNGTVTGGGTYDYGSVVTLTATANRGYKFVKWSDGVTTATRQVTVTGNATYTAIFMVDKIIADISFAQKILIDTSEVKAVLIDTTKVYG